MVSVCTHVLFVVCHSVCVAVYLCSSAGLACAESPKLGGPWDLTLPLPLVLRPQGSSGPLSGHRKSPPHSSTTGDPGRGPDCKAQAACSLFWGFFGKQDEKQKVDSSLDPCTLQHDPGVQHKTSRMEGWQQAHFIDVETEVQNGKGTSQRFPQLLGTDSLKSPHPHAPIHSLLLVWRVENLRTLERHKTVFWLPFLNALQLMCHNLVD